MKCDLELTDDRLRRWSKEVEGWAKDMVAIYVYFDNDQAGYAPRNALTLKRMLNRKNQNLDQ